MGAGQQLFVSVEPEVHSIGRALCCNPAVELCITVCGCAFDKMATPEKAIAIIPAPAYSVLRNKMLGLLTAVLDCEWYKGVSMLTTVNVYDITMNMCCVHVKRKKITLSSRMTAGLKSISLLHQLACCFILVSSGCEAGHQWYAWRQLILPSVICRLMGMYIICPF